MKPIRRHYQLYIDRSPQAVFQFFTDVSVWSRLCPPDEPLEILSGGDAPIQSGSRITLRVRRNGLWQKSEIEIVEWSPPFGFTERQISGPFALWLHRHKFTDFQGGTLMADQIDYVPQAGPLGALTDKLWLGKHLDNHYNFRQQEAKRLLDLVGRIKGRDAL